MLSLLVFAQRSAANQWLDRNPVVLALIFGVIGLALLFFGVLGLTTGRAKDKYGNELSGGMAMFSSVVRVLAGVGLLGFSVYKLIY